MFKCVSRRLHALNMMFKCLVDISIPANLLFAGSPQKYTVFYISEKHKREKNSMQADEDKHLDTIQNQFWRISNYKNIVFI